MAETANSIEFDVPKELLNKLTSSKEAFKAVLTGKIDKNEKSKEPPVNLVLEKMADNVVKIFATCKYASTCCLLIRILCYFIFIASAIIGLLIFVLEAVFTLF